MSAVIFDRLDSYFDIPDIDCKAFKGRTDQRNIDTSSCRN